MTTIKFTDGDKAQPVWNKLQEYWAARLDVLRKTNDDPQLTEQQTAALRGEIKQLKAFIALNQDAPEIEKTPPFDQF